MRTDLAFEVMEKILPDVVEILTDDAITGVRDDFRTGKEKPVTYMDKLLPLLTGAHREAVYNICAAVSGKTVEEVKAQELGETIEAWRTGFVDDILTFFVASLRMVLKA